MKGKYETHVLPKLELIKDWCRNGLTDENIAKNLGINIASFYRYKNEHSEFCESLKSKDEADAIIENALFESAKSGNITAMIFWLKNRKPNRWRDKADDKAFEEGNVEIEVRFKNYNGKETKN